MKHGTGRGLRAGFLRITGKRVDNWFDFFEEAPVVLPIVIDAAIVSLSRELTNGASVLVHSHLICGCTAVYTH